LHNFGNNKSSCGCFFAVVSNKTKVYFYPGLEILEMELQAGGSLLRYGIIGVGMMGREHQYNLAAIAGALVVAVADPDPGSRQQAVAVASALQLSRPAPPLEVFADHGSLLDSGLCDVVVVATPNMTHAQILLDILNHPKSHHILVEKPLCTTVEDCYLVRCLVVLQTKSVCYVAQLQHHLHPGSDSNVKLFLNTMSQL
jgi:hypothetical protein